METPNFQAGIQGTSPVYGEEGGSGFWVFRKVKRANLKEEFSLTGSWRVFFSFCIIEKFLPL